MENQQFPSGITMCAYMCWTGSLQLQQLSLYNLQSLWQKYTLISLTNNIVNRFLGSKGLGLSL